MPKKGVEKLVSWFASGKLTRPTSTAPGFVDLSRAIGTLCGAQTPSPTPSSKKIEEMIGVHDHYVFILLDGLGTRMMEQSLSPRSFLRSHHSLDLQAVWPSTTATALTTLSTGHWPCSHSIPGWWTRLVDHNMTITTMPFRERETDKPLAEHGITLEEVFPKPCFWPTSKRKTHTLVPNHVFNTPYSNYTSGNTPTAGYSSFIDAIEKVEAHLKRKRTPSFTYLYYPEIDGMSHEFGYNHEKVIRQINDVDQVIAKFHAGLPPKTRLVITADHGHAILKKEKAFFISEKDELNTMLVCHPSSEPAVPSFHVKKGREADFARLFEEKYGELFALITPDEAEILELYGPDPISETLRQRLGTFLAVSKETAVILPEGAPIHIGVHAGLSANEMLIGLILA